MSAFNAGARIMSRKNDDRTEKGRVDGAHPGEQRESDERANESSTAMTNDEVDASYERFLNRQVLTSEETGELELVGSADETIGLIIEEALDDEDIATFAKRVKLSQEQLVLLRTATSQVDLDDAKTCARELATTHKLPAASVLLLLNAVKARRDAADGPSMLMAARKRPR